MRLEFWQSFLFVIVVFVVLFCLLAYSNHYIITTQHEYTNSKLPQSFHGYSILQVSDLHGDLPKWKLKRLLQKTYEANPDIIVVTGDAIDHIHYKQYEKVIQYVRQIVKDFSVYYVTGNHEYMHQECGKIISDFDKLGVSVLHDSEVKLVRDGESIALWGVDDPYAIYGDNVPPKYITPGNEFIEKLQKLPRDEEEFCILLSHRPEFFEEYVKCKYDLVFTGHAHGGQWKLPFVGAFIAPDQGVFPQYVGGKYQKEGTTMFVSRGLGNSVVPFRFFNLPELVFVVLSGR